MINKKCILLIFIGCITQFFIQAENNKPEELFPDIKLYDAEMNDPNKNPLEQLIDLIYAKKEHCKNSEYCTEYFLLKTPNREVPLIRVNFENGKISYINFVIPHRIDMHSKYSTQIDEAVKVRQELLFVVFNFVRNVPQDETVDIKLDKWILHKARLVNAGKYGYLMCYNKEPNSDKDCGCMTLEEFNECLKFYKPNKKPEKS